MYISIDRKVKFVTLSEHVEASHLLPDNYNLVTVLCIIYNPCALYRIHPEHKGYNYLVSYKSAVIPVHLHVVFTL